jgi:hypothetical protein
MALAAFVAFQVVIKVIEYFWDKLVYGQSRYVTKNHCKNCAKNGDEAVQALRDEVRQVKRILLVIAIQAGVSADQLTPLVSVDDG